MTSYEIMQLLHSSLRWVVVVLAVMVLFRYIGGTFSNRPFTPADKRLGLFYMTFMDIQLLVGLALYLWFSPYTAAAMSDMGTAMKDPVLRFWAVEHLTGMIIGLVLAHIGYAKVKRGVEDKARFRAGFIFFGLSILIVMASIPWPFREALGKGWL